MFISLHHYRLSLKNTSLSVHLQMFNSGEITWNEKDVDAFPLEEPEKMTN